MKTKSIATSILALSTFSTAALAADDGPWTVFVRAAHLSMANDTSGAAISGLEVDNKTIPDISIRYAFTKNIAAELLLTVPQKQEVSLGGANIGSFKHLPPTLFAQYHFDTQSNFMPYVGVGVNYTAISDVKLPPGFGLDNSSWGAAAQIGFDYKVSSTGYISVDLKKIYISSDVKLNGAKIGSIDLNPTVFAIGYGFRF